MNISCKVGLKHGVAIHRSYYGAIVVNVYVTGLYHLEGIGTKKSQLRSAYKQTAWFFIFSIYSQSSYSSSVALHISISV